MADDAAPSTTEGQAAPEGAASGGEAGPGKTASPDNGTSGTADKKESAADEQTFYDSKKVPKHLDEDYRNMQAAFTKKMQALSNEKKKVDFYDQFSSDPVGNIQKLAQQFGFRLTREQAQAAADNTGGGELPKDWQPQSWDEVFSKAEERALQKVFGRLQPLLAEVKEQKKHSIEKQLSDLDPGWQQYEDTMVDLIKRHPSLATEPEQLYRLAVPPDVIESRATQRALKKLEEKAKQAAGAGGSTTTKKPSGLDTNQRFSSVQEAAAWAKKKLEEEGKFAPK